MQMTDSVDNEEELREDEKENRPAFLSKSRSKQKSARLFFSDDEDDDMNDIDDLVPEDEMHEEEREFFGLNDFFEDEAELSGSELGSADEREVLAELHHFFVSVNLFEIWKLK